MKLRLSSCCLVTSYSPVASGHQDKCAASYSCEASSLPLAGFEPPTLGSAAKPPLFMRLSPSKPPLLSLRSPANPPAFTEKIEQYPLKAFFSVPIVPTCSNSWAANHARQAFAVQSDGWICSNFRIWSGHLGSSLRRSTSLSDWRTVRREYNTFYFTTLYRHCAY